MPPLTLYFLQASRSIRIAWLLEELKLDYKVEFFYRENNKAPQAFREAAGSPHGKAPVLRDGDRVIYESGAIVEYLCANYDKQHRLIPAPVDPLYPDVLLWVHAAEGQFMLHALPILYTRWFSDKSADTTGTEEKMAANVIKDYTWLDTELAKNGSGWLVGQRLTAAEIMLQFSARWVLERGLGTQGKKWENVDKWLARCENSETYKAAVKKTGHNLENGGNKPE